MRRKPKVPRGATLLLLEYRSIKYNFVSDEMMFYYWDKKHRRIWSEQGIMFEDKAYAWQQLEPHRSIRALIDKYYSDFEKVGGGHVFTDLAVQVTEIGKI